MRYLFGALMQPAEGSAVLTWIQVLVVQLAAVHGVPVAYESLGAGIAREATQGFPPLPQGRRARVNID